ncbi:hypothetical protein [Actinocatenispora rupis]|uniref:Uncharacterized protein n=1 Tax=Actinocatenispora rupis TaxID=519421 RepID=A0A8J3J2N2_9ACTN|nr:hypothetical protein [Actinocatenispora rupis]GID10862.1 hypothetical protein Aru02nite_17510 [Actinocatenispora rupis]
MTLQYLVGEVSWRLAELAAAADDGPARELSALRRRAETAPLPLLGPVLLDALRVAERVAAESLRRGDVSSFVRQSAASTELYGFALCADLVDERLVVAPGGTVEEVCR